MLRRPGEQATAPQPVLPPAPEPVPPPPEPVPPPTPQPTVPTPRPRSPPPRRRRSTGSFIGIGFLVGFVVIGIVVLLLTRGDGEGSDDGATTGPATPDCTTEFFDGSLGDRVLGPCQSAMRGSDVRQAQEQLNVVLIGVRVLTTDGSYGPKTATAVHDYQVCRGIKPANSIIDQRTGNTLAGDTGVDTCDTSLTDLGPPNQPKPSPPTVTTSPENSPSPSPPPTDTLASPTTT